MKAKAQSTKSISNRRARHDYDLGDGLIVGIALTGAETKSLRRGHGHLRGAYVNVLNDELWLVNATITGDHGIPISAENQTRSRKLLAKRKEIDNLIAIRKQGLSIIPLELLTNGRHIKLRIASGKGRKKYDKRQVIKQRDQERSNNQELKSRR